jgi:hypothetical protein
MPKVSPGKISFNGGIWGPLLEGRIDHQKKPASLREGINVLGVTQGPALRRSSTSHIHPVRDESKVTALVPFVFSDEQALQLEFSDLKLRFFGDEGIVTYAPSAVTAIATASPFVITSVALTAAGGAIGKQVALSGFAVNQSLEGIVCNITNKVGDDFTLTIPGGGTYTGAIGAVASHTAALVYEIASPYAEADVRKIVAVQDIDVMRLFCKGYRPRTLSRSGATSWAFANVEFYDGPFLDEDFEAPTLDPSDDGIATADHTSASSATGDASGTSSTGASNDPWKAFDSNYSTFYEANTDQRFSLEYEFDVATVIEGYSMYIPDDNDDVIDDVPYSARDHAPDTWIFQAGNDGVNWITLDEKYDYVLWTNLRTPYIKINNKTAYTWYRVFVRKISLPGNKIKPRLARLVMRAAGVVTFNVVASATTGINGGQGFLATDVGRLIRVYQQDGFWRSLEITAWTNSTTVTVKLQGEPLYSGSVIRRWRFGAYSDTTGWPTVATFFEDRLALGGSVEYPNFLSLSVPGQYDVMSPTDPDGVVTAANGIVLRPKARKASDIVWLVGDERGLLVGTSSDEFVIGPQTTQEAFSASNNMYRASTRRGSALVAPAIIDRQVLYIQKHKKTVREFAYNYQVDGYQSPSMSLFASHLGASRYEQIVLASEPHNLAWIRRADGTLCSFVYNREEGVVGWYEHDVNGFVEHLSVIPSVNDEQDSLWLIVRRTVNSLTRRYIEKLNPFWESGLTLQDARYADCGKYLELASPAQNIYGFRHLEGKTVCGIVDGKKFTATVTNHHIVLPIEAQEYVFAGLPYETYAELPRFEAGSQEGVAFGKLQKIARANIAVWDSAGGEYAIYDADSRQFSWQKIDYGNHGATLPDEVELATRILDHKDTDGKWSNAAVSAIRTSDPLPLNIVAFLPRMETQDGG